MRTIHIDNLEFDESNDEFKNVLDLVKQGFNIIYITGKAGTGKTTLLKYLHSSFTKNTVILAPTGVAAINADGSTIHSFFQIPFGPSVPAYLPDDLRLRKVADDIYYDKSTIYDHFKYSKEKKDIISALELLIIDEISMVRCDLLDVIDKLLRVYRKRENEPFGGVKVVLIGDHFQLPPIAEIEQWKRLKNFYDSPFFFSSKVLLQNEPRYFELKKIYRQSEIEFIRLLNNIRTDQVNADDINLLNSKFNPTFSPAENENYITLATHNEIANRINLNRLAELPPPLPRVFEASFTGEWNDNETPTDRELKLKIDAQIMFVKNDPERRYYNGKIAKIKNIEDEKLTIEFSEGNEITVEKVTWYDKEYFWNEEKKEIDEITTRTFTQFPVKLAWAITVHKSQGLTFERVIADLDAAFAPGQVYVALSRCKIFNGLVLKTRIEPDAIKADPNAIKFEQKMNPNFKISVVNPHPQDMWVYDYKVNIEAEVPILASNIRVSKKGRLGAYFFFKKANIKAWIDFDVLGTKYDGSPIFDQFYDNKTLDFIGNCKVGVKQGEVYLVLTENAKGMIADANKTNNILLFAKHYYSLGFNVTCISNQVNEFNFTDRNILKSPNHKWKHLLTQKQTLQEFESNDWNNAMGVGCITGIDTLVDNYHFYSMDWIDFGALCAIDIDGCSDYNFVVQVLKELELPHNYEWVIRSGSKIGYHIIVQVRKPDFLKENQVVTTFPPKDEYKHLVEKVEMLWNTHLVLPPSIHNSGQKYEFVNCKMPSFLPKFIQLGEFPPQSEFEKIGYYNEDTESQLFWIDKDRTSFTEIHSIKGYGLLRFFDKYLNIQKIKIGVGYGSFIEEVDFKLVPPNSE